MLNKLQLSSLLASVLLLPTLAYIVHKKQTSPVDYSIDNSLTYPVSESAVSFDDIYNWSNDSFSGNIVAGDFVFSDKVANLDFESDYKIQPLETNIFYQYSNSGKDCEGNICAISKVNLD